MYDDVEYHIFTFKTPDGVMAPDMLALCWTRFLRHVLICELQIAKLAAAFCFPACAMLQFKKIRLKVRTQIVFPLKSGRRRSTAAQFNRLPPLRIRPKFR